MMIVFFDSRIVVTGYLTHNISWQDIRKKSLARRSSYEEPGDFANDTGTICREVSGMKPGLTGITRILAATKNSLNGIRDCWRYESAFRQNSVISIVLLILSFFLAQTVVEWLILIIPLFLLAIVELLNSAIENIVDRIGPERHVLSGRAKDMGSAGTMFCLFLVATVWLGMIWSKYFA